ncbi:AFG1/ZapE family ATPase [Arthrobacter sp. S39]|uniref:AFG1/ZapE family ATPase n=1 Tax=Arthrobacter sp. S39 TaxID=2509720 RepID=UPI0013EF63D0|nr:AFG1/ZapE family ATPase [Arthrobacter sp. S39]
MTPATAADGGTAPAPAHGRIITPGTEHQLGTYGLFPPSAAQQRTVTPGAVPLTARNAEPELLWIGFAELCSGAAARSDYRALADRHSTWVIDGVPDPEAVSAEKAPAWRRFEEAVEALCEQGRTLFVVGAHSLDWERATVAWQGAGIPGDADVPEVMAGIARRLSVLERVKSAAGAVPEGVCGS